MRKFKSEKKNIVNKNKNNSHIRYIYKDRENKTSKQQQKICNHDLKLKKEN